MPQYLSSRRPRFSVAEVPGSLGYVDCEQQLCKTRCFGDWQKRLERFNPNLHLAFDLTNGFWCIYRIENEARRLDTEERLGIDLGYLHPVPSVIHYIAWIVEEHREKPPRWYYRVPDENVLEELSEKPEASIDWDNGAYAAQRLTEIGEEKVARSEQKSKDTIDEIFDEMSTRIETNSKGSLSWKPMVSVPAEIPS